MLSYQISGLPVLDKEDNVIGRLTEHDIMNFAFSGEADVTKAKEVMTKPAFSFSPDTDLATIVNAFAKNRIRRVVITEQQKLRGWLADGISCGKCSGCMPGNCNR